MYTVHSSQGRIILAAHMPPTFIEAGGRADEATIKRAFEMVDSRITIRCENERWRSGATAVVAAVDAKSIALGWCGDLAILVLRSHSVERLSKCHSPSDPYGLILACDGVSDELEDADFYTHIREFCMKNPVTDWFLLSSHLCSVTKALGSSDNLTCLFAFLRPPSELWAVFAPDPPTDDETE